MPKPTLLIALLPASCAPSLAQSSRTGTTPPQPKAVKRLVTSTPETNLNQLLQRAFSAKTPDQTVFTALFLKERSSGEQVQIYRYFIQQWLRLKASNRPINTQQRDLANFSLFRLPSCGEAAKAALPDLLLLLQQKALDPEVRQLALSTMLIIEPDSARLDPFLVAVLKEAQVTSLTKQVITNLTKRKSLSKEFIPVLVDFVAKHPQAEEAIQAYGVLGIVASENLAFSTEEARTKVASIDSIPMEEGAAAFIALIRSKDTSATTRDLLLETLSHQKKETVIQATLWAFLQLDMVSDPSVLKSLLDRMGSKAVDPDSGDNEEWRTIDLVITNGVNPKTPQALPLLVAALQSPRFVVRQTAALALGQMKQTASPAVPALVAALQKAMKGQDYAGAVPCTMAICDIGPAALPSRTTIFNMMAAHSPYLTGEWGAKEFRSYWLKMITSIGLPSPGKKRQFILSQVMAGLRSTETEDISAACFTASRMYSERKQLTPLLVNILRLGEKAGGLMSDSQEKHLPPSQWIWHWEAEETYRAFEDVIKAISVLGGDSSDALSILQRYSRMPHTAALEGLKPQIQKTLSHWRK